MNDSDRYLVERDGPPDPTIARLERLLATKRYRPKRPARRRPSASLLAPLAAAAIVLATSAVCSSLAPDDGAAPAKRLPAPTSALPLAQESAPPPEPSPLAEPTEPVAHSAPASEEALPVSDEPIAPPPVVAEEALVDG